MDDRTDDRERRFRRLYASYYRAIYAFARRRVDSPADAFDIAEETFLVVWRRVEDLPAADPLPWLYGVARRVLANASRGRSRRERLHAKLLNLPPAIVELEESIDRTWEHQSIRSALERVKPDDRELLRLLVWEELSHRQVADVLGCSENAVALRFKRAKERLAAELAKENRRSGHLPPREPPSSDPGGD